MTVPVSALQSTAPGAIIELYELQLNVLQHGVADTYRFHAGANLNLSGEVVWAGNSYMRFPIEADGFSYNGKGSLPRPTLRVANLTGVITALLLSLPNGLEGAKVTRIRTLARYLDAANFPGGINPYGTPDPTAAFPAEIYYIDRKASENRDAVEFELAAAFDLASVRAPKRQCVNLCQWVYRGVECSYSGTAYYNALDQTVGTLAEDVCGKTLDSCNLRFQQVSRAGTVTSGSNILTLDVATGLSAGDPVRGFGVPNGTTVSSVAGAAVTMSANAVATTSVSRTGTLQTNRTQLVMSSVAGLAVGMFVSGPKIPSGTTIAGISGSTVTLGQAVRFADVLTPVQTRTTSVYTSTFGITASYVNPVDPSGIAVGQYVSGAGVDIELGVTITALITLGGPYRRLQLSQIVQGSPKTNFGAYIESTYTFLTPQAQTLQTYTFTAPDRTYTFRTDTTLPFGGFPSVGGFTA